MINYCICQALDLLLGKIPRLLSVFSAVSYGEAFNLLAQTGQHKLFLGVAQLQIKQDVA